MAKAKDNGKKEIITSAAIGTVVGAGLGVAAAALSDKKTRQKLVKSSGAMAEKTKKTVVSIPKQVKKTVGAGKKALTKASMSRALTKSSATKKKSTATKKKSSRSSTTKKR
jgi:hypothetical protein